MPGRLKVLRFLRDSEAGMREIGATTPMKIVPDLLRIANDIADNAAKLKAELIEDGLIPDPD